MDYKWFIKQRCGLTMSHFNDINSDKWGQIRYYNTKKRYQGVSLITHKCIIGVHMIYKKIAINSQKIVKRKTSEYRLISYICQIRIC